MLGPNELLSSGIEPPALHDASDDDLPSPPPENGPSHSLNGMVASGAWWLSLNYSGSLISWLGRYFHHIYCNWLIGGSQGLWGGIKWLVVCMKPEEDLAQYAASNSQHIISLLIATSTYWITHRFQRYWYRTDTPQDEENLLRNSPTLLFQLKQTQAKLAESEGRFKDLQTTLLRQIEEDEQEFSQAISDAKKRVALRVAHLK